jgi:chromosome segregation ATPase
LPRAGWRSERSPDQPAEPRTPSATHDPTRTEAQEAKAVGEERNRRIEDQGNELRELRRPLAEATAETARLEGEAAGLRTSLNAAQAEIDRLKDAQTKLTREGDDAKAEPRRLHTEISGRRATLTATRTPQCMSR